MESQLRLLYADMAELVDALDLGSSTVRCEGSSPFIRILNSGSYFKTGWAALKPAIYR